MEQDHADIGIWRLDGSTPQRYTRAELDYEEKLENWIASDPTLISPDMHFIGRQVHLDAGYLDILGIDTLGRWAVIELKKKGVRRDTVAQALDYAACLAEMTPANLKSEVKKCLDKQGIKLTAFLRGLKLDERIFEQPEFVIYLVGTSRDFNLNHILSNTTFQGNPIQVVTFDVYKNSANEFILLRQLSDVEEVISSPSVAPLPQKKSAPEPPDSKDARIANLMQIAAKNGIGESFRKVYEAATRLGLYPKTYKWSIMYAPPQNHNRVLMCAWVKPKDGLLDVFLNTDDFEEFYPISRRKARQIAGQSVRYNLDPAQTDEFIAILQKLFDEIRRSR